MSVQAILALLCAGAIVAATGCFNGSDAEGGDRTVAANPPASPEGAIASATDKGVTVSVLSLSVEESSTTVVYYVTGRTDLGPAARVGEPVRDQSGQMVMPSTGKTDDADPRKVTVTFHPIPHAPGMLQLGVTRVEFWDPAAISANQPVLPEVVEGKWPLAIVYDGSVNPAQTVTVETGTTPFGPGTFELLSASVESGSLVVEGRIAGFTEIQAQALHVTLLLTGPGGDFAPTNLRTGFGPGLPGLTARLATVPPPGHYTVRITMGTPSHPFDPDAVSSLQPYVGITAEHALDVP